MRNKIAPKLVILDRDGVINYDSENYIRSDSEWIPIPGSIEAIALMASKGIKVAIATNQSGIGRGYFSYADLHDMHNKMFSLLPKKLNAISYIAICPHHPSDKCLCRKPNDGLLQEISAKLQIRLNKDVYFIGDSISDINAANKANCSAVLLKTGKGLKTINNYPLADKNCIIFNDLASYVESIL